MQYNYQSTWCSSRSFLSKFLVLSLLGIGFLPGCITVGPDYVPPEQIMPDAWHQELTKDLAEGEENLKTWWKSLNDPILNSLIERAAAGNLDLQEAAARILEAEARRGISTGERFPDINGTGVTERSRTSEDFFPQRARGMITSMVLDWMPPGKSISGEGSDAWLKPTVMFRCFSLQR